MNDKLRDYHREGWDIRYLARVGSTNDWLLEAGRRGEPERLVGLADAQAAGRGRLDRRWIAPRGTCLLMSLLFRPPEPFAYHAPRTTMLCGLALADAIIDVTGVHVQLKWPNDLIVTRGDTWRKIAGMLSEVGGEMGSLPFLVVGIGLNVNVSSATLPDLDPNATSLLAECGRPVDRAALLDAFLQRVETRYAGLCAGDDPLPLWRQRLAWMGQSVQVQTPTGSVAGVIAGVDGDGALVLRLPDGAQQHFPVGDVTLRV